MWLAASNPTERPSTAKKSLRAIMQYSNVNAVDIAVDTAVGFPPVPGTS